MKRELCMDVKNPPFVVGDLVEYDPEANNPDALMVFRGRELRVRGNGVTAGEWWITCEFVSSGESAGGGAYWARNFRHVVAPIDKPALAGAIRRWLPYVQSATDDAIFKQALLALEGRRSGDGDAEGSAGGA